MTILLRDSRLVLIVYCSMFQLAVNHKEKWPIEEVFAGVSVAVTVEAAEPVDVALDAADPEAVVDADVVVEDGMFLILSNCILKLMNRIQSSLVALCFL